MMADLPGAGGPQYDELDLLDHDNVLGEIGVSKASDKSSTAPFVPSKDMEAALKPARDAGGKDTQVLVAAGTFLGYRAINQEELEWYKMQGNDLSNTTVPQTTQASYGKSKDLGSKAGPNMSIFADAQSDLAKQHAEEWAEYKESVTGKEVRVVKVFAKEPLSGYVVAHEGFKAVLQQRAQGMTLQQYKEAKEAQREGWEEQGLMPVIPPVFDFVARPTDAGSPDPDELATSLAITPAALSKLMVTFA